MNAFPSHILFFLTIFFPISYFSPQFLLLYLSLSSSFVPCAFISTNLLSLSEVTATDDGGRVLGGSAHLKSRAVVSQSA
jgi:hypothetical protein